MIITDSVIFHDQHWFSGALWSSLIHFARPQLLCLKYSRLSCYPENFVSAQSFWSALASRSSQNKFQDSYYLSHFQGVAISTAIPSCRPYLRMRLLWSSSLSICVPAQKTQWLIQWCFNIITDSVMLKHHYFQWDFIIIITELVMHFNW